MRYWGPPSPCGHSLCVRGSCVLPDLPTVAEQEKRRGSRSRRKSRPPALREWAEAVKARDGACVVCGSVDGLHAHHVKPRESFPELALVLENGQTLCRPHHREAHPELPALLFV